MTSEDKYYIQIWAGSATRKTGEPSFLEVEGKSVSVPGAGDADLFMHHNVIDIAGSKPVYGDYWKISSGATGLATTDIGTKREVMADIQQKGKPQAINRLVKDYIKKGEVLSPRFVGSACNKQYSAVPVGLSIKKVKGGYEVIHTKSGNRLMPFAYPEKQLATDFAIRAGQVADWTRPFKDLQAESEKLADLIRGGKKPGMFEKVLDMPTTFPKEKRMREKLDTAKVGRITSQLSYIPGLPFQGREHTVIIDEIAKAGWRYLGDSRDKKPDAFLIKEYGLKDVHRATIPLEDGRAYIVWVGRPTNEAGRKEIKRLATDKLGWLKVEPLPAGVAKLYVKSKEVTEVEDAAKRKADDERMMARGRESVKAYTEEKLRGILATAKDTLKRKYISDYDQHIKPMEIEIVLGELQRRGLSEKPSRKRKATGGELAKLQAIHDARSPRSKSADESQSNALTLDPDDPRVDIWERDPGRADVKGIDTPRKSRSKSGSSKKPARKSSRGSNTPTQVRGIR